MKNGPKFGKDYYDNKDFDSNDVYDISKSITKENELFDYAKVLSYLKISKKNKMTWKRMNYQCDFFY